MLTVCHVRDSPFPPSCVLQSGAEKQIPVMLVANKIDLREEAKAGKSYVSFEDGQRVARVTTVNTTRARETLI